MGRAMEQNGAEGVDAAFMRNHRGDICIAFSDPAYARAEFVVTDRDQLEVHVILHESAFFVGCVSESMMAALENSEEALLTAIRPDGSLLELTAPIQASTWKRNA